MLNLGFIPPQEKIHTYFFNGLRFKSQSRAFKLVLYSLVLLKLFYYAVYYELYFGIYSFVYTQAGSFKNFRDLAFVLYNNGSTVLPAVFMVVAALCCLYSLIVKRFTFLPDLIGWFCILNLHNKVYPTLTGGDFLLNQFLFIGSFLSFRNCATGLPGELRALCHNVATIALLIQICFIYAFSSLAKMGQPEWMNGSALQIVAQVDYFSLYSALRSPENALLFRIMTWFVLFYQLLFPLLMWFRRIKKPLLVLGVLMHVYIAVVLGLVQFSLVMMAAYVFLWPRDEQTHLK